MKKNSKFIVSIIKTHLAMSIMGVLAIISAVLGPKFIVGTVVFIAAFYAMSMYTFAWRCGFADVGRANIDLVKRDPLRGFKLPAIMLSVPLASALVTLLFPSLWGVNLIMFVTNLPAMMSFRAMTQQNALLLIICSNIVYIISAGIGYILGTKDIALGRKIVYKENK